MAEIVVSPPDSEVAGHYHARRLVVFPDLPVRRLDELRRLPVHRVSVYKKMKAKEALSKIRAFAFARHPLRVWAPGPVPARALQDLLRENEAEARDRVRSWFPGEEFGEEMNSWRYTVTQNEALHYDEYADRVMNKVVRVFVNLDSEPRLWDVGEDRQRVAFPPGATWLVDSRRVAHAIIYGRRAGTFSFELRGYPWDAPYA